MIYSNRTSSYFQMITLSAVFFCISLALSVIVGPQTRPWTWGPSLIFLALSILAAVPALIRNRTRIGNGLLALGFVTITWFTWRACNSPVAELGMGDLLLVAGAVGAFIVMIASGANRSLERIFFWTLSGLLLASCGVIAKQIDDPSFHPIFSSRPVTLPSGFFGHYNECANFLTGGGLLLAGVALFGPYSKPTRITWGITSVLALAAVYFTRSRGGILAVGSGIVVFAAIAFLISKRRNERMFGFFVVMVPVLVFASAGWVYKGWEDAQTLRFQTDVSGNTAAASVVDSSIRLHLFGIAASCIGLHPLSGGGSRSYSWECNQFWNARDHGAGNARLEYVHNELLQSATDYGIVGFLLLITLLSWISMAVIVRACSGWSGPSISEIDALHIGGLAGLAGMFVQSNFSFVFHLFPGVLLLGVCLGRMALRDEERAETRSVSILKGILILCSIAICCFSLWMGTKGTIVVAALWKTYLAGPKDVPEETKIAALSKAVDLWPQSVFYSDRAYALQMVSDQSDSPPSLTPEVGEAIEDYQEAIRLHPFDPNLRTNIAGLLGLRGNAKNAEFQFLQAGSLEGGMEATYRAHFKFCDYLVKRGMAQLGNNEPEAASSSFEEALRQFEFIKEKTPWIPDQLVGLELRISLLAGIGMSEESQGDAKGALATYDEAAKLYGGGEGHYRAGALLGKMAETAWLERQPSKAIALFLKARQRLEASGELTPGTRKKRDEYLEFVIGKIQYLKDAKIEPVQE